MNNNELHIVYMHICQALDRRPRSPKTQPKPRRPNKFKEPIYPKRTILAHLKYTLDSTLDSLVVEHDVREPDVGGGHVKAVHAPVLLGVPPELVIKPVLLDPQVGSHHLLAEVLGELHFIICDLRHDVTQGELEGGRNCFWY